MTCFFDRLRARLGVGYLLAVRGFRDFVTGHRCLGEESPREESDLGSCVRAASVGGVAVSGNHLPNPLPPRVRRHSSTAQTRAKRARRFTEHARDRPVWQCRLPRTPTPRGAGRPRSSAGGTGDGPGRPYGHVAGHRRRRISRRVHRPPVVDRSPTRRRFTIGPVSGFPSVLRRIPVGPVAGFPSVLRRVVRPLGTGFASPRPTRRAIRRPDGRAAARPESAARPAAGMAAAGIRTPRRHRPPTSGPAEGAHGGGRPFGACAG